MKKIFSLIVLTLIISGCSSTKPIVNLHNEPISTSAVVKDVTLNEAEAAILEAGERLGWESEIIKPGKIESTLILRSHKAVVDISYTDKEYSIDYKSSENLNYKDGKIHKNYNSWIANFSKKIQEQIIYRALLTGKEVTVNTAEGLSIWKVDDKRIANPFKIMATKRGQDSIEILQGVHKISALVHGQQIEIGFVDYKGQHEYFIGYFIEDETVYYWVKDLTDDEVVYGKEIVE